MSCLLNLLCTTMEQGTVSLSDQAKSDISCFKRFLPEYNGVSLILDLGWREPGVVLATDACLARWGCVCKWISQSELPTGDHSEGTAHICHRNFGCCSNLKDIGSPLRERQISSVLWQWSYCIGHQQWEVQGHFHAPVLERYLREIWVTSLPRLNDAVHLPGVDNKLPDFTVSVADQCPGPGPVPWAQCRANHDAGTDARAFLWSFPWLVGHSVVAKLSGSWGGSVHLPDIEF